jgi:hypothetical protein
LHRFGEREEEMIRNNRSEKASQPHTLPYKRGHLKGYGEDGGDGGERGDAKIKTLLHSRKGYTVKLWYTNTGFPFRFYGGTRAGHTKKVRPQDFDRHSFLWGEVVPSVLH